MDHAVTELHTTGYSMPLTKSFSTSTGAVPLMVRTGVITVTFGGLRMAKLAAKVGHTIQVIVDEVDDEGATCRTMADAPEIDGNLFIDEGFEGLKPGDMVTVTVEEAGEYDLWGRRI